MCAWLDGWRIYVQLFQLCQVCTAGWEFAQLVSSHVQNQQFCKFTNRIRQVHKVVPVQVESGEGFQIANPTWNLRDFTPHHRQRLELGEVLDCVGHSLQTPESGRIVHVRYDTAFAIRSTANQRSNRRPQQHVATPIPHLYFGIEVLDCRAKSAVSNSYNSAMRSTSNGLSSSTSFVNDAIFDMSGSAVSALSDAHSDCRFRRLLMDSGSSVRAFRGIFCRVREEHAHSA
jgi:hypothetical protein